MVEAALAEIDRGGLAAFSLRNLARRLRVFPTAVYWHVPGRNRILAEVVAHVLDSVAPGARRDWRAYLRLLFERYRDAIKRHPNVAPLIGGHTVGNLGISLAFVEELLAVLTRAGFAGSRLVAAYNAVVAGLTGFVTQEFAPIPDDDTSAWEAEVQERLRSVDAARHPILAANLPLLANRAFILRWQNGVGAPMDESFAAYVDALIAGLERLRPRRR